jgi:outer membrane protein assembly factor BamB
VHVVHDRQDRGKRFRAKEGSPIHTPLHHRALLAVALLSVLAQACNVTADWPAFRGGTASGACSDCNPPTNWSEAAGVDWELAIPGRGCSSPIVTGNDVFVSTVYPDRFGAVTATLVRNAVPIFSSLLACLGLIVISGLVGMSDARSGFMRLAVFAATLSLLIFFAQFGHDAFNYARSCHYRWIGSFLIVLAFIVICDFTGLLSAHRQWLGLGVVALGVSLIAFEPGASCLYRPGWWHDWWRSVPVCVELSVVVAMIALGGLMFLGLLDFRLLHDSGVRAPDRSIRRMALVLLASCVILAALLLIFVGFVASSQFLRERLGRPQIHSAAGPWATWLLFGGCGIGMLVGAAFGNRLLSPGMFRAIRWLAGALALAVFLGDNVLVPNANGVRAIYCIDLKTGAVKWVCEGLIGPVEETLQRFSSPANPTCAADATRVIGYFGNAGIMCASRDGRLAWTSAEPIRSTDPYGSTESPLLVGETVIVGSNEDQAYVLRGFDARSGKLIWTQTRPSPPGLQGNDSRRSPSLVDREGSQFVVIWGPHDLRGYHISDGTDAWSYPLESKDAGQSRAAGIAINSRTVLLTCTTGIHAIDRSSLGRDEISFRWHSQEEGPECSSPVLFRGLAFWVTEYGNAYVLMKTREPSCGNMSLKASSMHRLLLQAIECIFQIMMVRRTWLPPSVIFGSLPRIDCLISLWRHRPWPATF